MRFGFNNFSSAADVFFEFDFRRRRRSKTYEYFTKFSEYSSLDLWIQFSHRDTSSAPHRQINYLSLMKLEMKFIFSEISIDRWIINGTNSIVNQTQKAIIVEFDVNKNTKISLKLLNASYGQIKQPFHPFRDIFLSIFFLLHGNSTFKCLLMEWKQHNSGKLFPLLQSCTICMLSGTWDGGWRTRTLFIQLKLLELRLNLHETFIIFQFLEWFSSTN